MIGIIDYGVGNIFSIKSSLEKLGYDCTLVNNSEEIKKCEKLILPGVGAFSDAAKKLYNSGMWNTIIDETKNNKKPLLGICLGMQLLFEKSFEYGEHKGLGLINGEIVPLEGNIEKGLKIPHIGWNVLKFSERRDKSEIFRYLNDEEYVYFVHSYYAQNCDSSMIAYTVYGGKVCASVQNENIYGMQFHPEKSGNTGLNILKAFCEL